MLRNHAVSQVQGSKPTQPLSSCLAVVALVRRHPNRGSDWRALRFAKEKDMLGSARKFAARTKLRCQPVRESEPGQGSPKPHWCLGDLPGHISCACQA